MSDILYIPVVIIAFTLTVCAYIPALKYNVHMFQLNGYKNGEHMVWLKKHFKRQWVLAVMLAGGITGLFIGGFPVSDILMWLWLLLIIIVYRALNRMSVKKKLVYTARVKRLIACVVICDIAIIVLSALMLRNVRAALMICVGLKSVSCIIANVINSPIEKAVNRHFINDAKRILKSCPDMKIIGVTGSYGKTSVKYYLGELLGAKYNVLITPESYNTPMGVVRTVREHLKPGTDIFVCEMGARHVGDIKELCDLVHPDHGIITSIGPQHLDTFFNMENIISTKFELADAIPDGGMLFLNGDNEYIAGEALAHKGKYLPPVIYHTGSQDSGSGGYAASGIKPDRHGTVFTVAAPDGTSEEFRMSLIGAHNVINVTGAIAVAHSMGISLDKLRIPVRRLKSVPHRLELIRRGELNIIDDAYNSNPVGSKAALDTLALFDGCKIMITPGMVELGEREEEYNREFGRHAADICDHVLLVGRKRAVPIMEGALDGGMDDAHVKVFDHLEDAFSYAQGIRCEGEKFILLENDLPDNY